MKTIQSESETSRESEACCDDSNLWLMSRKHIQTVISYMIWIAAIFLIALITLGYFLNPSALRIIWLVISGTLLVIALPVIIFWNRWRKRCQEKCHTENQPD